MTTKLFGTRVQRVEDQRFLRGKGRYVDDVAVGTDVLHAAVLRSPHAHARITAVDTAAAEALPGVQLVLTCENVPTGRPNAPWNAPPTGAR